jgi:alkylation response protein AidB-like acyl-CoA dehydrogenase
VRAPRDPLFGPEHTEFREQARAFLLEELDPARTVGHRDPRDLTGLDEQFEREILRRAGVAGFLGISLPEELGGGGRAPSWDAVVSYESAYHDGPLIDTAAHFLGPTLVTFGTPEQLDRIMRPAIAGTINACIAYTEAGAGSDLTGVTTVAVPERADDDAGFALTGEKVLVTGAHKADWCCTVARTDVGSTGRKGLSMFVFPMTTPGVTTKRVRTANGWDLGTVRFDDARVGPEGLLGERDQGWRTLTGALIGERSGVAWLGWATRNVDTLLDACTGTRDRLVRDELAGVVSELFTAKCTAARVLVAQDAGLAPFVEGSMSKVKATELLQRIARLGARVLGPDALTAPGWFGRATPGPGTLGGWFAYETVERLHPTLSVGANEIQRTTIGQVGLGLPLEPR